MLQFSNVSVPRSVYLLILVQFSWFVISQWSIMQCLCSNFMHNIKTVLRKNHRKSFIEKTPEVSRKLRDIWAAFTPPLSKVRRPFERARAEEPTSVSLTSSFPFLHGWAIISEQIAIVNNKVFQFLPSLRQGSQHLVAYSCNLPPHYPPNPALMLSSATIISEYLASQTIAHFMVEEALERLLLPSSSLSVVPSTGLWDTGVNLKRPNFAVEPG